FPSDCSGGEKERATTLLCSAASMDPDYPPGFGPLRSGHERRHRVAPHIALRSNPG
ncbi:unnamed protein product, partial [Urochloa humidicola]